MPRAARKPWTSSKPLTTRSRAGTLIVAKCTSCRDSRRGRAQPSARGVEPPDHLEQELEGLDVALGLLEAAPPGVEAVPAQQQPVGPGVLGERLDHVAGHA